MGYKIFIPAIKKIEVFGYNQSNLKLTTDFGEVRISWAISFHQLPAFSEPFVEDKTLVPLNDFHDFDIILKLDVDIPEKKIFKKELKEFMNWVEQIEFNIQDLNWENKNSNRMINLISELTKVYAQQRT